MKEFDKNYVPYLQENKVEINVKKQQEIEHLLQGSIVPKKGHFVWEVNEETGVIKKAEYKCDTVGYHSMVKKQPDKLIVNPDCVYIPALNPENAKKKYLKNKEQSFYFVKAAPMNIKELTF